MLSLSNVGMHFGPQTLFEGVDWHLLPGAHYGLVGANGSGKSTVLRILTGEVTPEQGTVSRPNDVAVGVLGQDQFRYDAMRLLDVVLQGRPALWAAWREKAELLAQDEAAVAASGERLGELEAVIADRNGYEAEAQAGAILEGLGIPTERHQRPMSELSGGYRLRVLLAQTLFAEPDVLLLDEPTNHLDLPSIRWLEGHLRAFAGTLVVVSHDRHFLNAVCEHIADIDYRELTVYTGDYDRFEAQKALAEEQRLAEAARAEKRANELQQFADRFRAKANKARQAQSKLKQLERIEIPEIKRTSRRYPAFRFVPRRPSGQEVLRVQDVRKAFGGQAVLDGVSFTLKRGEKLAVVGPNGVGKSTLLNVLAGTLAPDAGRVEAGYEVHLGHFAQDHKSVLRGRTSAYEWLYAQAPGETVSTIRGTLGKVLFSGDDVHKPLQALSGGEGARLTLAGLMLAQDNLLVLDEPTNHLDLEGREALREALAEFPGTLVFVSHDRHFVDTVAGRVLVLRPGGYDEFTGSYAEYLARHETDFLTAEGAAVPTRMAAGNGKGAAGGNGAQDHEARKARKREASRLRKQVSRLETEAERLQVALARNAERFADKAYADTTSWQQMHRDQAEQERLREQLRGIETEWEQAALQLEVLQAEA